MAQDAQIQALLRRIEADEVALSNDRRSLAEVAERRQADWQALRDQCTDLETRISELRGKKRRRAAHEKRMDEVAAGTAFIARLEQERKELLPELEEKRKDAERAGQRLGALDELRDQRIELFFPGQFRHRAQCARGTRAARAFTKMTRVRARDRRNQQPIEKEQVQIKDVSG